MNTHQGHLLSGVAMGFAIVFLFRKGKQGKTIRQANRYFPVQSPSEVAAGHPIVGVS